MTNTTDISKLYSLMEEDPGKYKEIINNEHKVRMAIRNWPLVRAMASPPVEIPPVLVGEKFENKININQVARPVREAGQRNNKPESTPKNINTSIPVTPGLAVRARVLIEEKMLATESVGALDNLKFAISEEVENTVAEIQALNIIELSKRNTRETTKIRSVIKLVNEETKLSGLFSRLEGGQQPERHQLNLLKLRRV